ncbi:MAG: glycosyltransferase family 2 protein [Candidatus Omnitrophica bacterium]|nr:glycosyltransferase family 2 protein [Candidatus Omnitrophota bacterium]
MKISILMPVYNEQKTIMDILELVRNVKVDKEIILVDDSSTDGTRELLKKHFGDGKDEVKVFYHDVNKGKGAGIKTALSKASGEYVIVQDGDLEYSPHEIEKLVQAAKDTGAVAIFGSRFLKTWKTTSFPHYMVNWTLTAMTNFLFRAKLTDMETCYKMIKTSVMRSLDIQANRFEFEPEVTAKLLKKGVRIEEVAISYRGRSYDEGKKITWKDGIETLLVLLKYRFVK